VVPVRSEVKRDRVHVCVINSSANECDASVTNVVL